MPIENLWDEGLLRRKSRRSNNVHTPSKGQTRVPPGEDMVWSTGKSSICRKRPIKRWSARRRPKLNSMAEGAWPGWSL